MLLFVVHLMVLQVRQVLWVDRDARKLKDGQAPCP